MSDTTNTNPDATDEPQAVEDDPIAVRRAKREALLAAGADPYGHAFTYSHHLADLVERYAGLEDGASMHAAAGVGICRSRFRSVRTAL